MFALSALSASSGSTVLGKSNGFMRVSEAKLKCKKLPPTASQSVRYSFSGSMIIISVPIISERKHSSLMAKLLPAPDFAKTTILAFSRLNLSNSTKPLFWRFMPYKMPSFLLKLAVVNGKLVDIAPVSMLRIICNSSVPIGRVELKPCSICTVAGLVYIKLVPSMPSILRPTSFNSFSSLPYTVI